MARKTGKTIAIITLSWDCNYHFFNLFKSLKEKTKNNFAMTVFDNGSDNETFSELMNFLSKDKNHYVIRSETNLGFAKGNNKAVQYVLAEVDADYVFFINADISLLEDKWDEKMLKVFDEKENVGVVGAGLFPVNWDSNANFILDRQANKLTECQTVQGSLFCMKIDVVKEVIAKRGYFMDEDFSPAFHEESEMMIYLLENGYRNYWVPVDHFHDSMASPTKKHAYKIDEKCGNYKEYQELKQKHRILLHNKHKEFFY